jgi:alpha-L-fucosidase 2
MSDLKLWYRQPANIWEEALPIGSGRMGAMVFSGVPEERICLNEDTLWSGGPWRYDTPCRAHWDKAQRLVQKGRYKQAQNELEKYMQFPYTEAYEPFGEMLLHFERVSPENITNYKRSLSLDYAKVSAHYLLDGNKNEQRCLISNKDDLLIWRMVSQKPCSVTLELRSVLKHELWKEDERIGMTVRAPSFSAPNYLGDVLEPIRYEEGSRQGLTGVCIAEVLTDGSKTINDGKAYIKDAKTIEIRLSMRTNFERFDVPPAKSCINALQLAKKDLNDAKNLSYQELLQRHLEEYQPYFNRVSLQLSDEKDDLPTDIRLERSAEFGTDKKLVELIFQYGRYLLIASSRPGTQAATLQGIWNAEIRPPWSSNYTLNINTEMNYWPAEICNLPEMHEPMFALVERLRKTGAATAQITYGARGVVCHHNTDLWAHTQAVGINERDSAMWSQWPMGYVWLVQHLMTHFRYSRDTVFLRDRALPALRDACAFLESLMVQDSKGQWIFSPATSPENQFLYEGEVCSVSQRSTMNDTLVKETFESYLEALSILKLEEPLKERVQELLNGMPNFEIGADGRLLEWEKDFKEVEPGHRHVSHLYGLYPGTSIVPKSPLAEACKKSLLARGDAGTGWSLGWKLCLWARLGEGERALKLLSMQLTPRDEQHANGRTYPNLFDAHPPFQIDGNFSACAGVAEMLLSSGKSEVRILHALPKAWESGHVKGLRTVGGYEAEIIWADGRLVKAVFKSVVENPAPITLQYLNHALPLFLKANETAVFSAEDFK